MNLKEEKFENHWKGDSIELRNKIFDWLYSEGESGYDIEEFPIQNDNRFEEFGYGDVAIIPMEVSGYKISFNQDYVNSHQETAGDRYIAEVFFMNGRYILFGTDRDYRYEGETVEEFEKDFIKCLDEYDKFKENMFFKNSKLFESIFRESSANMFVNAFVNRFNKTSPNNWDVLQQFVKMNLGSAVGSGTEGLKNDLPLFYQKYSDDSVQQIIAACAVRSNNPNNVLVFFNKYKNALGLTFNQDEIMNIVKKALETGEKLS